MTAAGSDTHAISRRVTVGSWLRPWRRPTGYVVVLAGAAATGLAFGVWGDDHPRQRVAALDAPPPQTDPGALTAWGLPIVRLAVIVAVVGTVGMLAGALLLPREDGKPGAAALRCLRSAAWAALAWAVAMVALLLLSWSDVRGIPVLQASIPQIFGPPAPYPAAVPYLYAAALALVIAGAAAITRTVTGVLVVLLLCGYNVLPLTTRDQQVDSSILGPLVTVHVLAIAVWVGSLAALLAHARRSPALLAVALPRFNRLALACFVVVGAFGVAAAWINLGSAGALGASHFGTLVVYKAEALIALGVFGWWARRRIIPDLRRASSHRPFVRFATIEVAVMAATLGLGSALTHTTAPAVPDPTPKIVNPYLGALGGSASSPSATSTSSSPATSGGAKNGA